MHSYEFLQVTESERDRHTNIDFTSSGDKVQLMNTFTHTHTDTLSGGVWLDRFVRA